MSVSPDDVNNIIIIFSIRTLGRSRIRLERKKEQTGHIPQHSRNQITGEDSLLGTPSVQTQYNVTVGFCIYL